MSAFSKYSIYKLPPSNCKWQSSFENPKTLLSQYVHSLLVLFLKSPLHSIKYRRELLYLRSFFFSNTKPSLVLGGGPSLSALSDETKNSSLSIKYNVFAVNYYSDYLPTGIKPSHVVLSDPNTIKPPSILRDEGCDPELIDFISLKQKRLLKRLSEDNPYLFLPASSAKTTIDLVSKFQVFYFNDYEARFFNKSINPLFPRSYTSMTAYKALALSCFLSSNSIFILGIDNTYPHDILVSSTNTVCRLERHAGLTKPFISDHSSLFSTVADALCQMATCFSDLHKFPQHRIVNLDMNSLVDAFPKRTNENIYDFLLCNQE